MVRASDYSVQGVVNIAGGQGMHAPPLVIEYLISQRSLLVVIVWRASRADAFLS